MKADLIFPQAQACTYEAWATLKSGVVRRLTLEACSQSQALEVAFAMAPGAVAVSVREADRATPCEAFTDLERRA